MNAFKVELVFVNFDGLSEEEVALVVENTTYPNRCISPTVAKVTERDIGEWSDDHPLNKVDNFQSEIAKLFYLPPLISEMTSLTDDQRMEIFSHFCHHCGCKNPSCQCWNDE